MNSTLGQLKDFARSELWQDLRLAILTRLSQVRNELEVMPDDIDLYKDAAATSFLRGRAFEIRYLSTLPDDLIEQIEGGDLKWQEKVKEEEPELEEPPEEQDSTKDKQPK